MIKWPFAQFRNALSPKDRELDVDKEGRRQILNASLNGIKDQSRLRKGSIDHAAGHSLSISRTLSPHGCLAREYLRTDKKSGRRAEILKELSELAALLEVKEPTA